MNASTTMLRGGLLSAAMALAALTPEVSAQEMDHSKMQMPAQKPAPATPLVRKKAPAKPSVRPVAATVPKPKAAPAMDHSKMQMPAQKPTSAQPPARRKAGAKPAVKPVPTNAPTPKPAPAMDHSRMPMPAAHADSVDHAAMGHDMPMPGSTGQAAPMDHSKMTDAAEPQPGADQSMKHDMSTMPAEPAQPMDHSTMAGMTMAPTEPITPIPALTDADRAAAVPPPGGHTVHDNSIQSFVLVNRMEAWNADRGAGMEWEGQGWVGTDLNRLWLRSEGERVDGRTESADIEVMYGRSIARWWDLVAGVRHDFKPGPSQDFAAIGIIGLAPQKFEVEATAYIGTSGQTALRFEVERELLLTNRLVLQPLVEANLFGKDDTQHGIGSGLSTMEVGLRLRYEIIREFAPYIGIVRERAFGGTADLRRAEGEDIDDTRLVAGIRIWF